MTAGPFWTTGSSLLLVEVQRAGSPNSICPLFRKSPSLFGEKRRSTDGLLQIAALGRICRCPVDCVSMCALILWCGSTLQVRRMLPPFDSSASRKSFFLLPTWFFPACICASSACRRCAWVARPRVLASSWWLYASQGSCQL